MSSRIELLRDFPARPDNLDEQAMERSCYETMLKVLTLAQKLDPRSVTVHIQLATVEEYFGNYESAHRRMTELIDSTRVPDDRKDRDKQIDWIVRRSRVAYKWAAELCHRGDAASSNQALALVEQAAKALAANERYIADLALRRDTHVSAIMRVYYFYWTATETRLSLGEIARDLGRHAEARLAFQSAKKAFDYLDAFTREQSMDHVSPTEFEALRNRVRAGLLTPLLGSAR